MRVARVSRLRREARRDHGRAGSDVLPAIEFSVVNVRFDALADAAERRYLLNLPTTLSLPPADVDRLRAAAAQLLSESPAYKKLVSELGSDSGAPSSRP
jgi:NTE family protein